MLTASIPGNIVYSTKQHTHRHTDTHTHTHTHTHEVPLYIHIPRNIVTACMLHKAVS
ncbi:hypothetical protein DsansV1_C26g0194561 [Dioscorea sansibarensis]